MFGVDLWAVIVVPVASLLAGNLSLVAVVVVVLFDAVASHVQHFDGALAQAVLSVSASSSLSAQFLQHCSIE